MVRVEWEGYAPQMLRPRALVGADSDIAENASATDALEPAAGRPKKAFWVAADLDWPATARIVGAAMDMVMVAIFTRRDEARCGLASRSEERGNGEAELVDAAKEFFVSRPRRRLIAFPAISHEVLTYFNLT